MSKEQEDFQKRVYQLHQHGSSYCVTIPKPLVTEAMVKHGVYIELIDYSKSDLIIRLVAANEYREHAEDSQKSRSDAQKSRTANDNQ